MRFAALLGIALGLPIGAVAQTSPNLITNQVPTAVQWNSYFTGKADATNGILATPTLNTPVINNGAMTGTDVSAGKVTSGGLSQSLASWMLALSQGQVSSGTINSSAPITSTLPSSTAQTLGGWAGNWPNVKFFGAVLNGVTDDSTAFNNARIATGIGGTILVPSGGFVVNTTPTGGPTTPVLWQLSGNSFGTGTSTVLGIGTDTVETFSNAKIISRLNTVADMSPVVALVGTVTHTGGSTGFVIPTLRVLTTINAEASALNDYVWGISSTLNSSATGPGQHVAVFGGANRLASGSEIWGANFFSSDQTGFSSSTSGAMVGSELGLNGNGADDYVGGSVGLIPAGSGIRVIEDMVASIFNGSGSAFAIGWGSRLSGPAGYTVTMHRGYSVNNFTIDQAAFDTSYSTISAGANAYRMAAGQSIGFDVGGLHTLAYNSGTTTLNYQVSGTTRFALTDAGTATFTNVALNSTGIGVGVAGTTTVGFDTSAATLTAALRMAANQDIALEASNSITLSYNGTGIIAFKSSGTDLLDITGSGIKSFGTVNAVGVYQANGTAGVACSGTPTSSFASVGGIVTHC